MSGAASQRCVARDVGREAVYAAEEATFGGTDVDEPLTLARLVAQATAVAGGTWWQSCRGPRVDVIMARAGALSSSAAAVEPRRRRPARIRPADDRDPRP